MSSSIQFLAPRCNDVDNLSNKLSTGVNVLLVVSSFNYLVLC